MTGSLQPASCAGADDAGGGVPRTEWGQLWLLFLLEFIVAIGFGVIYPYLPVFLQDVGHAQPWLIGVVASAVFVGTFLFSGLFGRLCDRIGRKPVLIGGSLLFTTAMFLFLTTTDPWWFVGFRFLEGVATAAVIPAVNALIADFTEERQRSQAFGWMMSAQFGGLILGPALAVPIYSLGGGGIQGFHAIFLVGGVVTGLVSAALLIVLREPARSRERLRAGSAARPPSYRRLATPPVAALILVAATANFATGGFEVLWSIWLKRLGASLTFISLTWIAFSIPMLLSFLGGRFADRSNRFRLALSGYAIAGVCYLVYGSVHNLRLFLAVNVIEGLAWAWSYPAKEAFLIQVSPQRWLGAVQGMQSAAIQVAAFIGTVIAPVLYGGLDFGGASLGFIRLPVVRFGGIGGYALSVDGVLALAGVVIAAPVLRREWRLLAAARAASAPAGGPSGAAATSDHS